jgi:hypothetical protein
MSYSDSSSDVKQTFKKGDKKKGDKVAQQSKGEFVLNVGQISVDQKNDKVVFNGSMSKVPAFRIRFHNKEVKLAKVVKSLLRFINKNLRMKDVKSVVLVSGKKKEKLNGDKLDSVLDLSKELSYDEVTVVLG